jgi:hypothetical protein
MTTAEYLELAGCAPPEVSTTDYIWNGEWSVPSERVSLSAAALYDVAREQVPAMLQERDAEIDRLKAELTKARDLAGGIIALMSDERTGDVGRSGALNIARAIAGQNVERAP